MSEIKDVPNFKYKEFGCKCKGCKFVSGRHIDPRIPKLAQLIRNALGRPLKVNSACRCGPHNSLVNGSINSQHLEKNGFKAVDLDIRNSHERRIAVEIALEQRASIGLNKRFLHFDFRDENKPIIFLY